MRTDAGLKQYNLGAYGAMIADTVRMQAYRAALELAIKPGMVVLDLGAGTGIMSLLACKLGAAQVHAVEPSDAIAVARELARANGCADRIEFHQQPSFELALARRADVVVSDLRGVLPLLGRHIPSIVDARERLLAPGGTQIPARDAIDVQLVGDAPLHAQTLGAWRDGALGLDLSAALRWASGQCVKADLSRAQRLGAPQRVVEIDYRTVVSPDVRGRATWVVQAPATAHGLGAWFDTILAGDIGFSNAPDRPRAIYGQMFFPLPEALELRPGDAVDVELAANLVGSEYVWRWSVDARDRGGARKASYRQSSFQAMPVNPARLQARAGDYVPQAGDESRAAARALALFEQRLPVEAIAAQLCREFPALYATAPERARELVGDLSDRFGG
jgi:protein arginine N-methyltransferase 1